MLVCYLFKAIFKIRRATIISYNVLRVSEVAEGDLGEGVSPNQIHAVS